MVCCCVHYEHGSKIGSKQRFSVSSHAPNMSSPCSKWLCHCAICDACNDWQSHADEINWMLQRPIEHLCMRSMNFSVIATSQMHLASFNVFTCFWTCAQFSHDQVFDLQEFKDVSSLFEIGIIICIGILSIMTSFIIRIWDPLEFPFTPIFFVIPMIRFPWL